MSGPKAKPSDAIGTMYMSGDSNYTRIHQRGRTPILRSITLGRYEKILPDWLRISKSHLVNPEAIKDQTITRYYGGYPIGTVTMTDGTVLSIARRRVRAIEKKLKLLNQSKNAERPDTNLREAEVKLAD